MDSGSWFDKLIQFVVGLIIVGVILSALQAALCEYMPLILLAAVVVGVAWLIVWIIRGQRDRW